MAKVIKFKPVINKKNKQMNFSFSQKNMPTELKKVFKKNPSDIKMLNFKFEGFE